MERWAKEHPEVMQMTSEFVKEFSREQDPVVAVAEKEGTREGKIAWALLGSDLFQEISLPIFTALFEQLQQEFPEDRLWAFPLATGDEIRRAVQKSLGKHSWPLKESVPGIFWSVGNFIRRHSPVDTWASSTPGKEIFRSLGEIFFMGKGAYRPKAVWTLSRLFSPAPRGLGILASGKVRKSPAPFPFGLRQWIGLSGLGADFGYAEMGEPAKRRLAAAVCKALSPEDPRIAAHAFTFFGESPTAQPFLLQLVEYSRSAARNR